MTHSDYKTPAYVPATAPMREGADSYKSFPSVMGGIQVPYAPPVGPCAGMAKSNLSDAEKKRLRSLTWRGGK